MSVQQRGAGWRAQVRRRGLSLSATFPTHAEALAWRANALAAIERGEVPQAPERLKTPQTESRAIPEPLTVEQAAREWVVGAMSGVVKARRGRRYRESSVRTHEGRLRLHVLPYLGGLPAATVTPGTVRRWLEELEAETSATTARMALDSLRIAMRRLLEHELIPSNPCSGVQPPVVDGEARPLRYLDPAEAVQLREAAHADRQPGIGPFVDLGLATGARRGELLALTWGPGGLDLEAREVTIAASYSLHTRQLGPTKNGQTRSVPVGGMAVARAREYRMAAGRPPDGARVFPFDPRQAWERVRAGAGLAEPLPTIHSLRHTAATWWLAAGLTVHAVAELLGHADPTLVLKRYGHALPSERSSAGERLEAFLAGAGG